AHNRGSKKYVLMELEHFIDFLRRFRIQNYNHISKRIHNKSSNKEAILHIVNMGVKTFRKDHPNILKGEYQQSLVKRIAGQIYCWLYNDMKLKELKGEVK
ncbi:MAG: hypothetical protein AABY22_26425, partial [Nanoarchaeota archaeon]